MATQLLENYIDGRFVASTGAEAIDLVNPVDETVVARCDRVVRLG